MKRLKLLSFFVLFSIFSLYAEASVSTDSFLTGKSADVEKDKKDINLYWGFQTHFIFPIRKSLNRYDNFSIPQLYFRVDGSLGNNLRYTVQKSFDSPVDNKVVKDTVVPYVDIANISYNFNDSFSVILGKQKTLTDIFSKDLSNKDPYIISYMGKYNTGLSFVYKASKYSFSFQFVNNNIQSLYTGTYRRSNIEGLYYVLDPHERKFLALGYLTSWNGSFLKEKVKVKTSFSIYKLDRKESKFSSTVSLCMSFDLYPFTLDLNCLHNLQDLDVYNHASLAARDIKIIKTGRVIFQDVIYDSYSVALTCEINKNWYTFVRGMYEFDYCEYFPSHIGHVFRTETNYDCGIEYYPMGLNGIKLYGYYSGFWAQYTYPVNIRNENMTKIALGAVYHIKII